MEYTDKASGIKIRVNRDAHESVESYKQSLRFVQSLKDADENPDTKPKVIRGVNPPIVIKDPVEQPSVKPEVRGNALSRFFKKLFI